MIKGVVDLERRAYADPDDPDDDSAYLTGPARTQFDRPDAVDAIDRLTNFVLRPTIAIHE